MFLFERRIPAAAGWLALLAAGVAAGTLAPPAARAQAGDLLDVHDPSIIRAEGRYYIFCTGEGIPFLASEDLWTWRRAGRVFPGSTPDWAPGKVPGVNDVWAPDVSFFNGRYQIYYSLSTFGSQRSVIALATSASLDPASPDSAWRDEGAVIESAPGACDFNAIDPHWALDENGDPWLLFGSFWTGIKITRLDPATRKRPAGAAENEILPLAMRPGGNPAIEAPFLIRRGGYFYLFVSFDQCCAGSKSTYHIRIGRSPRITGPYVDCDGTPMLAGGGAILLAGYDHIRGPGHNSVLQTPGGDFLVHHFYDASRGGARTLQIRPILWSADGWPLAGEPWDGTGLASLVAGNGATAASTPPAGLVDLRAALLRGEWSHQANWGEARSIRFLENGRLNSPEGPATWALDGARLTLRWPDSRAPGGAWEDDCVVAPNGRFYVGRNQSAMDIRGRRLDSPSSPPVKAGEAKTP